MASYILYILFEGVCFWFRLFSCLLVICVLLDLFFCISKVCKLAQTMRLRICGKNKQQNVRRPSLNCEQLNKFVIKYFFYPNCSNNNIYRYTRSLRVLAVLFGHKKLNKQNISFGDFLTIKVRSLVKYCLIGLYEKRVKYYQVFSILRQQDISSYPVVGGKWSC